MEGYKRNLKDMKRQGREKRKEMKDPEKRLASETHQALIDAELAIFLHRKQPEWELRVNDLARKGLPLTEIYEEMKSEA